MVEPLVHLELICSKCASAHPCILSARNRLGSAEVALVYMPIHCSIRIWTDIIIVCLLDHFVIAGNTSEINLEVVFSIWAQLTSLI